MTAEKKPRSFLQAPRLFVYGVTTKFIFNSAGREAANKIILLIDHLNKKNPSDKVTVAELWEVAEIDS